MACASDQTLAYRTTNHGVGAEISAPSKAELCQAVAARVSDEYKPASCLGFDGSSPYGAGSVAYSYNDGTGGSGDLYAETCVAGTPPNTAGYWDTTPHLLQALLVVCVIFMFVHGYTAGRRIT
jgi:hypothetical protein